MAAITLFVTQNQATKRVRTATAQATTGQTDWVSVPRWARFMRVYFNLTAITGTSSQLALLDVVPITLDDAAQNTINLAEHPALTAQTAASLLVADVGPGVTGVGNDVTNSATANSYVQLNTSLPPVVGLKVTNVVGAGSFTYTLTIAFRW